MNADEIAIRTSAKLYEIRDFAAIVLCKREHNNAVTTGIMSAAVELLEESNG